MRRRRREFSAIVRAVRGGPGRSVSHVSHGSEQQRLSLHARASFALLSWRMSRVRCGPGTLGRRRGHGFGWRRRQRGCGHGGGAVAERRRRANAGHAQQRSSGLMRWHSSSLYLFLVQQRCQGSASAKDSSVFDSRCAFSSETQQPGVSLQGQRSSLWHRLSETKSTWRGTATNSTGQRNDIGDM